MKEKRKLTLVLLESPYIGETPERIRRNIKFARACERDCFINHGEAPTAFHLQYPQPGFLMMEILMKEN
jgi:hypothetical protein